MAQNLSPDDYGQATPGIIGELLGGGLAGTSALTGIVADAARRLI